MKKLTILIALLLLTSLLGCKAKEKNVAMEDVVEAATKVMNTEVMMEADEELIEGIAGLSSSDYEECVFHMPMTNIHASQILVVKVNEDQKDATKEKMEKYLNRTTELFSTYVESEYELLKEAELFTKGDYIILLVGDKEKEARKNIEDLF